MLLCPPHSATSPKRTSEIAKFSPVEHEKEMATPAAPTADAGVGGSACRHTPVASALAW
jgi:hypothetical protein